MIVEFLGLDFYIVVCNSNGPEVIADGPETSLVDRRAMGEYRTAVAQNGARSPGRTPAVCQPQGSRRAPMDLANGRSLAGPAGPVSQSQHVLATASGM